MKAIIPLFVFISIFYGCEEEARKADFTKEVRFDYQVNQPDSDTVRFSKVLDFWGHGVIDDYRDYAESYRINDLSYQIVPLETNEGVTGTIEVTFFVQGVDTTLLLLNNVAIEPSGKIQVSLPGSLMDILSDHVNQVGQINSSISYAGDLLPGDLVLYLYFNTTVSTELDF